jgi:hypothetical protein
MCYRAAMPSGGNPYRNNVIQYVRASIGILVQLKRKGGQRKAAEVLVRRDAP